MPYAPIGDEHTISWGGADNSSAPKIVGLSNGGYVVAYQQSMGDPYDDAVYISVFDAAGANIALQRVNVHIQGSQNFPDVAALAGGGFVVTWSDNLPLIPEVPGDDDSGAAVRGRIYSNAGAAVGGEFLLPTTTTGDQFSTTTAGLANGDFIVLWSDDSGDPVAGRGVRGQIFSPTGAKVGGEIVVPSGPTGETNFPDVAALAGGGFVAVWEDSGKAEDPFSTGIFGRVFDATGAPVGSDFLVNTTTAGAQGWSTSVTMLTGGGFVVAWEDNSHSGGDTSGAATRAQVFTAGAKVGGEILVNTTTTGDQNAPDIAAIPGGGFVVTWTDFSGVGADPSGSGIKAQLYNAVGAPVGTEFLINTTTDSYQSQSAVGLLTNGDFVVVWQDPAAFDNAILIRAQIFHDGPVDPGTNDTVTGTQGANTLSGQNGDDTLIGLGGNDLLYGGAGDDILRGGAGSDYLSGGLGTDTVDYADLKGVSVYIDLEAETAYESTGAVESLINIENVRGSREGDEIYGDEGVNRVKGETGNDLIFGRGGNDVLQGDGGDDTINGGEGYDVMSGGAGHDTFVFAETPEGDLLGDWQAGEVIDLSQTFITAVQLVHQYGRTWAYFDTGDGTFDDGWILVQNPNVQQSDFVFGP